MQKNLEKKPVPSMEAWLREAKQSAQADKIGMYLSHNGIVRRTAKAQVRDGADSTKPVAGLWFSYTEEKVEQAIQKTYEMEGIYHVRVWLNEGLLSVGDDIMYVLIGGDIRPHVVEALQFLVGTLKEECVEEREIYEAD